jgi:hypothetical protein
MIDIQDIHRILDISVKMAFHKLEDSYSELSSRITDIGMRKFYLTEYPLRLRNKVALYREISIISFHHAPNIPTRVPDVSGFETYATERGLSSFIRWLNGTWAEVMYEKIIDMIGLYDIETIISEMKDSDLPCATNYANILKVVFSLNK